MAWASRSCAGQSAGAGSESPQHGAARFELFEAPVVHADLSAAAILAAAHEHRAAASVEIEFVEVGRFLDAQAGAPEDDDQRASARAVLALLAAAA